MSEDSDTNTDTTASETWTIDRDPATGRFLRNNRLGFEPGNVVARSHGVRAFQDHGEAALPNDIREELAAFRAGVETDQGGTDELTTLGRGYLRRLCEVEGILQLLSADLETRGLLTQRGRVRTTFHAFMSGVDRWDRLARTIGVTRKAKHVESVAEILREHQNR